MDATIYGLFVGIVATILILMKLHTIETHTDAIGEMLHVIIYHPDHIEDLRLQHEESYPGEKANAPWKTWDDDAEGN